MIDQNSYISRTSIFKTLTERYISDIHLEPTTDCMRHEEKCGHGMISV